MEKEKSKWELLVQIGISIPILTFVSFGAICYYQYGYFDYYKIPKEFIEIEPAKNIHLLFVYVMILFPCVFIAYLTAVFAKSKAGVNLFITTFFGIIISNFFFDNFQCTILPLIITDLVAVIFLFIGTVTEIELKNLEFIKSVSPNIFKVILIPVIIISTSFIICYQIGYQFGIPVNQKPREYGGNTFLIKRYSDFIMYGIPDSSNEKLSAIIISRGKDNSDTILIPKSK